MHTCVKRFLLVLLSLLVVKSISATIINIPGDHSTIQEGIDNSFSGDTVLVAEGIYFENIIFRGKNIVVSSHFLLDNDPGHIFATIIDGSSPTFPDSASVVRIIDSEDSSAVLQGFTIQHGAGTVWIDEHGAGTFREGGGILTTLSSPVIQYNIIVNNQATNNTGVASAGGGAIRSGDGNPRIQNNIIMYNQGRYGGGIVLNYAAGIVRNNLIAYNSGGEDFGGSGIWKYQGTTALIENNTIVNNASAIQGGGGVYCWVSTMDFRNNIVRGNIAPSAPQIRGTGINASFNNIEGGYTGTNNIDSDPEFIGDYFYLSKTSPSNDAGYTTSLYLDNENLSNPGKAQWPSHGTTDIDLGMYGGPDAFSFEQFVVSSDIYFGWVPFNVSFELESVFNPSDIIWHFGDGDSASGALVNHSYFVNGLYDVSLDVTANGNDFSIVKNQFIAALADTIWAGEADALPGQKSFLTISAQNSTPVNKIVIPIEYGNSLNFALDSISTVGCRTDYFDIVNFLNYDTFNKRLTLNLTASLNGSQPELPPGIGPIVKLYFTIHSSAQPDDTAFIDLSGYNSYTCKFDGDFLSYLPGYENGLIFVSPCCIGIRGNIDYDGSDKIDIADIVFLVNFSFGSPAGPAPACFEEADVNGDLELNIGDLVYMVDYSFGIPTGPEPLTCPN